MNPYEESELESKDLYCDNCWCLISVREYHDNCGLCDDCAEGDNNEVN
jgi:uncharacterized CHY-type Zn-finger protein